MANMVGIHMVNPKLVVFDLDYTLWPFYIDRHVDPPFHKNGKGDIQDRCGKVIETYPDVRQIFEHLRSLNIAVGVASRTGEIRNAHILIDLLGWNQHIALREIHPGCKIPHFQSFNLSTGIAFGEMIFFDDEMRNIRDVSRLGVTCIHAKNGMSFSLLLEGLRKFAQNRQQFSRFK